MTRIILASAMSVLLISAAIAQPAPPSADQQALGAEIMAGVQEKLELRKQIITLQAENAALKAKLEATQKADVPPK